MKFRKDLPEGGGKNFVKLKDKEWVAGLFAGDIHEFFVKWEGGKPTEVVEGTPGASFRFRVNLIVKEGSVYVPKIFEQGVTVYKTLAELHDMYPFESTLMKITRHGSSQNDTTYTVLPLPQKLDPETIAHIKTIKLNDLTGKSKSSDNSVPWPHEEERPDDNGEIPF